MADSILRFRSIPEMLNFNSREYPNIVRLARGVKPRASQIAPHSAYNKPIATSPDRVAGYGRGWAEASLETKGVVISEILEQARARSLSKQDAAFLLAVAHTESGFNPDAAAAQTSASGIGQFVKKTGEACGVSVEKRFDYKENISGFIRYMSGILDGVSKSAEDSNYVEAYSRYHDGRKVKEETREYTRSKVIPAQEEFLGWIEKNDAYEEPVMTLDRGKEEGFFDCKL